MSDRRIRSSSRHAASKAAASPVRRRATQPPPQVLQFLIVLLDTNPLIWRRIQVPDSYSFWDLHVAIQDAMGWHDSHLHEFHVFHPRRRGLDLLGIPDDDFPGDKPYIPDWTVPIAEYFNWDSLSDVPPALYVYDFGDDWRHTVTCEEILPRASRYPRCVAGARRCPPDDCGGIRGFEDFLRAIRDPQHPEHADLLAWIGGAYDPEDFDPKRVMFDNPRDRWKLAFED
jgi:hypothetical protein